MPTRTRPSSSTLFLIGATAALLGMSGCLSNDQRSSNLKDDNDEAVANVERRLKDSARVNAIVSKIDLALRPVAEVMGDVEKFLKAGEKEALKEKVSEVKRLSISIVRRELDQLKRGLVKKGVDGDWSVAKTVEWPFDRAGIPGTSAEDCSASTVRLTGELVSSRAEEVKLLLSDCALGDEPATLLRAEISEKMEVQAELNLGDLEAMLKTGAQKGPCSLQGTDLGTQLECAPFVEKSGRFVFEFEKISYIGTKVGEIMDFALKVSEAKDGALKPLARATVDKKVGQKMKVDIERL